MSIGGFVENVGKDAFDTLKGLYEIIPGLYHAGRYTFENLDRPDEIIRSAKNLAIAFKDAIIEPYQKHGLKALYYRPMTSLLDALTIFSLGAGSVAKVAKVGGLGKLQKMAEAAQALPGRMARGAIDKGVFTRSRGKYDLAQRRAWIDMMRGEKARGNVSTVGDMEAVGRKVLALSDDERKLWHKFRTQGGSKAELAANPKVAEAFEAYRKLAHETWQPWLERRGLLSQKRAKIALAKKMAAEVDGLDWKEALKIIDNLEVKPVYGPAYFERAIDAGAEDFVKKFSYKSRKVGQLEKLRGAKGSIADPAVYVPRAIAAFRQLESKLNIMDQTIRNPNWVQAVKSGEVPISKIVKGPIFDKYFEKGRKRAKAGSIEFRKLKGEVGEAKAKELLEARDPETLKRMREAKNVVASPQIQRLLDWEFNDKLSVVPGLRLYDKILQLFRVSATKYNPGYVTGNAVGDALLGSIYGADWLEGIRLKKAGAMPSEVTGVGSLAAAPSTGIGGFIEKWGDVATAADQATRAGIVTRAVYDHLAQLGISGERAFEMVEPILRSTDEFARVQLELQRIEEQIVRGSSQIQRRDKEILALVEKERRVAAEVEKLVGNPALIKKEHEALRQTKNLELQQLEAKAQAGLSRAQSVKASAEVGKIIRQVGKLPGRPLESILLHDGAGNLIAAVKNALIKENINLADDQIRAVIQSAEARLKYAEQLKAMRSQARSIEGGVAEATEEVGRKLSPKEAELESIRQQIVNKGTERDELLRDMIDDFAKSGELEARVPGLKEQSAIVRKGIEHSNAFVGDYLGLSGFEQQIARRLIPFYPWAKAMTMLAFRLPFIAPVKTFMWNRFAMALMSVVGDKDLPEYAQGAIPIFALKDGRTVWIKLSRFSPFAGLRMTKYAGNPIPNLLAFGEQNPFLTLDFKFRGGRTIFEGSGIPYGQQMVNISNGDTYEFTERGTLRRVIPQTPFISGVVHMFPVTQLIEDILAPLTEQIPMSVQGPVRGFLGLPRPILKPDGSYRYPHEWWQSLTSMVGLPTYVKTREDFIKGERFRVRQAIAGLRKAYRRASPDEQAYYRASMQDYARGEYRRMER